MKKKLYQELLLKTKYHNYIDIALKLSAFGQYQE